MVATSCIGVIPSGARDPLREGGPSPSSRLGMTRVYAVAMRPERTEAIVLNTYAARERDKLVVFLTPEHGKKKGWAYGARSLRSRFGAALEPLAKVRIAFLERESEEVVRIESVDLIRSLFPAQQNLVANVAASYIAETVDTFAQSGDPADLIYRQIGRASCRERV